METKGRERVAEKFLRLMEASQDTAHDQSPHVPQHSEQRRHPTHSARPLCSRSRNMPGGKAAGMALPSTDHFAYPRRFGLSGRESSKAFPEADVPL